jgi:hypothetical protein
VKVPKGADDIHVIFYGTESGLNAVLWAPWFSLRTSSSLARIIESGTFMGDADTGEIFLNFFMDKSIFPFAGVDLAPFLGKQGDSVVCWYQWGGLVVLDFGPHHL